NRKGRVVYSFQEGGEQGEQGVPIRGLLRWSGPEHYAGMVVPGVNPGSRRLWTRQTEARVWLSRCCFRFLQRGSTTESFGFVKIPPYRGDHFKKGVNENEINKIVALYRY